MIAYHNIKKEHTQIAFDILNHYYGFKSCDIMSDNDYIYIRYKNNYLTYSNMNCWGNSENGFNDNEFTVVDFYEWVKEYPDYNAYFEGEKLGLL